MLIICLAAFITLLSLSVVAVALSRMASASKMRTQLKDISGGEDDPVDAAELFYSISSKLPSIKRAASVTPPFLPFAAIVLTSLLAAACLMCLYLSGTGIMEWPPLLSLPEGALLIVCAVAGISAVAALACGSACIATSRKLDAELVSAAEGFGFEVSKKPVGWLYTHPAGFLPLKYSRRKYRLWIDVSSALPGGSDDD